MDVEQIQQILEPYTKRGISKNSLDDYLLVSFPRKMMKIPNADMRLKISEKLTQTLMDKTIPKNFYVHYEQCTRRCTGCHYGVQVSNNNNKHLFSQILVNQILKNIHLFPKKDYSIDNAILFFGGGTPSLMTSKQVDNIYTTLREQFNIRSVAEATLEIHPEVAFQKENLNQYLTELKDFGITRLSVGIQDINNDVLKKWHRGHTQNNSLYTYELIKHNDFRVNIDLMWGLPNQSLKNLEQSLQTVFSLNPDSVTTYYYWLRPDCNDYDLFRTGKLQLTNQPIQMRKLIRDISEEFGYTQRNVDWFEKGSDDVKYISTKWGSMNHLQLAIGPSAYTNVFNGLDENYMLWSPVPENNNPTINKYADFINNSNIPYDRVLIFNKEETIRRHFMYNLKAGTLNKERFEYLQMNSTDREISAITDSLIKNQLLEWKNNILKYTDAGDIIPDQIAAVYCSTDWLKQMGPITDSKENRYYWFPDAEKIITLKKILLE